jgi:RNA recognition motif-containing protein
MTVVSKENSRNIGGKENRDLSEELTYQGTSKGVTRERHCTSHKVIFVDNLPQSVDKLGLIKMFQEFGEILDVKFLKHKTGPETGYGFIEFAEADSGRKAIKGWNWKLLDTRLIRVSRAKPSTNKLSGTNLYIENVPFNWTDKTLYEYFKKICKISEARILMDQKTEKSRGVGFVHCATNKEARKAIGLVNNEHCGKNGLDLNVKFAKIPRAERSLQRERQVESQTRHKGRSSDSSEEVGDRGSSSMEGYLSRSQDSHSHLKQEARPLPKLKSYYKYNQEKHLSHCSGLQLSSAKMRRLSKSKRRMRRKQFQKKQMKKVFMGGKTTPENINASCISSQHLRNYSYEQDQISSLTRPFISGKPESKLTYREWNRGESNRTQQCVQSKKPRTNVSTPHSQQQCFSNNRSNTEKMSSNMTGNYVVDNIQNGLMFPQGTLTSAQTAYPLEYAASVASTVSSVMSSPLGMTPMNYCASYKQDQQSCGNSSKLLNSSVGPMEGQRFCRITQPPFKSTFSGTSVQPQTPNISANSIYAQRLPIPYTQYQPLTSSYDTNIIKTSDIANVVVGNQMQQFGCKNNFSGLEHGFVYGRASGAEINGHQMNVGTQYNGGNRERHIVPSTATVTQGGVSQNYCLPESQYIDSRVSPYGVSQQPQQQCWSTGSCSSVDSFSTGNEDVSNYWRSMSQFTPGGIMQGTKMQTLNQKIQVNGAYGSNSHAFDPSVQVWHSMGNLAAYCVDTRSDSTSTHSDLGVPSPQCNKFYSGINVVSPAQSIWANQSKITNDCMGAASSVLKPQQECISPKHCIVVHKTKERSKNRVSCFNPKRNVDKSKSIGSNKKSKVNKSSFTGFNR